MKTTPNFVTNCAWCKETIDIKNDVIVPDNSIVRPIRVALPDEEPIEVFGIESHSICDFCRKQMMVQLNAVPTSKNTETACCHGRFGFCIDCEATVGNGGGA